MNPMARGVILISLLASLPAWALGAAQQAGPPRDNRADAYFNFSMGHLYAELAGLYGNRGEYLSKAIEYYKQAIKADSSATFLSEELAGLYIQPGKVRDAVSELEDRLKKDPQAGDARRVLGRIYARLIGDPQTNRINEEMLKKAIEQYKMIVAAEPKDIDSWVLLGRLYKVSQNSIESEQAFRKALEIDPASEEALTGLAMVYSGLGDNKRAAETLKQVADRNPNLRTLTSLAGAYEELRDYANAVEVLKRALEMEPANLDLKRGLAQDLLFAGKLDDAIKTYTEVAEADPKDTQSLVRISQIQRRKRDFVKAREALDRAKQIEPDDPEIRYSEVTLLDEEGRHSDAIARMQELVASTERKSYTPEQRANRVALLERLGVQYRANQQYKQAIDVFQQIPVTDPEMSARSAAQVVDTLRQGKDFNRAVEEADAAARKYPNDRTLALTRASLLAEVGKGEQAAAEVRKLFNGEQDKDSWLALAQISERSKNYAEMGKALEAVEKLAISDDDKGTVYFMRGAMQERQKNYDAAEAEFRKALAIDPDNAAVLNYLGYMLADRNVRL
ncbi:MAG: tetratricopeptide repeat protein, partial [Acidobacteriales bacterium]